MSSSGKLIYNADIVDGPMAPADGAVMTNVTIQSGIIIAEILDRGGAFINVKAHGATGDGSDQSVAINAALTVLMSNPGFGGVLYFPKGQYVYDNPMSDGMGGTIGTLLLQDVFGIAFVGEGVNNTHLWPSGSRADKWIGKPFIDGSGSFDIMIRDMEIGNGALVNQNLPDSLIWVAQPASNHTSFADATYGVSGWGTTNALAATNWTIENVRFSGPVQYGHFAHCGLTSSQMRNVTSYVQETTIVGEDNDTNETTCFYGVRDNPLAIESAKSTSGGVQRSYPQTVGPVAGNNNTNWLFDGIEFHNAIGLGGGANSNAPCMRLEEPGEYTIHPKNMSCFAPGYIRCTGATTGGGTPGIGVRNMLIDGQSAYTEGAGVASLYVFFMDTQTGVASPSLAVNGLEIRGLYAGLKASEASAAVIHGVQGAIFKSVFLTAWDDSDSYTGQVVSFEGTGGKLQDSVIHCRGFGVNMGSAPASDALDGTTLYRPGTISMASHNARIFGATANQIPGLILPQLSGTGDLLTTSSPGVISRIALGTGNHALHVVGTAVAWAPSLRSIMQAVGDLAVGTGSATFARLAIGASQQVLTVIGGTAAWASDIDVGGWIRAMSVSGTPTANAMYRQSLIKGWVKFAGATTGSHNGTVSYNLASNGVTRNGTGDYTISWDRDFSSADYVVSANAQSTGGAPLTVTVWTVAAGTTQIQVQNAAATLVDPVAVHVLVIGMQ